MNRYCSPFVVLLVTMSNLSIPSSALAGQRAYHSRGTAHFVSAEGDFVGSGNATHLGKYTEIGNAEISPTGGVSAWSIYTAANGDQLYATFAGQIDLAGAITATVTYVGGTGRFANASGSATLSGQIQQDGSLVVTVDGSIDY